MDDRDSQPAPVGPGRSIGIIVAGIVVLCVLIAAIAIPVICRNQLVSLNVEADTQWKQVENQLERQYELLPKLAAVTRRYAGYESSTLETLARIQARYQHADERERPKLAARMDGALVQVMALATSYPDLKADRNFRDLAFEIAGTKNRIAVERARYNEIVGAFNTRLQEVPWKWVATGLRPREFYSPSSEALRDPDLRLE